MYELTLQWQFGSELETRVVNVGFKTVIGRHTDCDVVVRHNTVSRRHAVLSGTSQGIFIRNISQTNPITLNFKHQIVYDEQMQLSKGDLFQLGRVKFKVIEIHNPLSDRVKKKCPSCGKLSDPEDSVCPWCGNSMESAETLILPKR